MLDVARDVVLAEGARAATINRIVEASGVPKGSVYHRFGGIDDLLAAMWVRSVRRSQQRWLAAVEHPDPVEGAVAAALSVYDFAVDHPGDARLLASLRREDLVERTTDPRLVEELGSLNDGLHDALVGLARAITGRASRRAVEQIALATADLGRTVRSAVICRADRRRRGISVRSWRPRSALPCSRAASGRDRRGGTPPRIALRRPARGVRDLPQLGDPSVLDAQHVGERGAERSARRAVRPDVTSDGDDPAGVRFQVLVDLECDVVDGEDPSPAVTQLLAR